MPRSEFVTFYGKTMWIRLLTNKGGISAVTTEIASLILVASASAESRERHFTGH
jgi:hypothetical protein